MEEPKRARKRKPETAKDMKAAAVKNELEGTLRQGIREKVQRGKAAE